MSDEIIDLTRYIKRESGGELPRGAMALWGAEGERSRFALPLWRVIYLAQAERGVIVSRPVEGGLVVPFVALDLAQDPARIEVRTSLARRARDADTLVDLGSEGLVVRLGERGGRVWELVVDGGETRSEMLPARAREDILFLAGECAGLLFLKDLADELDADAPQGDAPPDA